MNDIESWFNDKQQQLAKQDVGRDEDSANKLIAKHKVSQELWRSIPIPTYATYISITSRFSINSEANASEFLENCEEMFPC